MSLTRQLKDSTSPVAQWMSKRMSVEAAAKFVARQNRILAQRRRIIVDGADPVSVGRGFDYAFRWTRQPFVARDLVAWDGAKEVGDEAIINEIVDRGNRLPFERPRLCVALGLYEEIYRSGVTPEPITENVELDELLKNIPRADARDIELLTTAAVQDFAAITGRWIPNPTFDGSQDVGGADADWLIGDTLYECKTSRKREPFEIQHLQQLAGYALLDYQDKLKIRNIAWYFPRQRTILAYPIEKVIPGIDDAREQFRAVLLANKQVSSPHYRVSASAGLLKALDDIAFKHHGDEIDFWDEEDD